MSYSATTVRRWLLVALLVGHAVPSWGGIMCTTDDAVTIPHASGLNLTGDFTLTAWIRPTSFGTNSRGRILDKISSNLGYMMGVDNFAPPTRQNAISGGVNTVSASAPISLAYASNTVTLATVQHVAFTHSAANAVVLYVNGEPQSTNVATLSVAASASTANLSLCATTPGTSRFFDGVIDEVTIHSSLLNPLMIRNMAASRQRRRLDGTTPLVYLPLDDCATGAALNGTTLADRSPGRWVATASHGANLANMTCDTASIKLTGHGVW